MDFSQVKKMKIPVNGTDTDVRRISAGGSVIWRATHTIKFYNYDGTLLDTREVLDGDTPSYGGSTPTKASTISQNFTFSGWSPSIVSATSDASYTASFSSSYKAYTLTISATNTGYGSYSVSRTSSPYQGAPTGTLSNGATIYYGDVLTGSSSGNGISASPWDIASVTAPTVTSTGDATSGNITVTNADSNTVTLYYNTRNAEGGTSLGSTVSGGSQTKTGLNFNTYYYCSASRIRSRDIYNDTANNDNYTGTNGVTGNVTASFGFTRTTTTDTGTIYSSVTRYRSASRNSYTLTYDTYYYEITGIQSINTRYPVKDSTTVTETKYWGESYSHTFTKSGYVSQTQTGTVTGAETVQATLSPIQYALTANLTNWTGGWYSNVDYSGAIITWRYLGYAAFFRATPIYGYDAEFYVNPDDEDYTYFANGDYYYNSVAANVAEDRTVSLTAYKMPTLTLNLTNATATVGGGSYTSGTAYPIKSGEGVSFTVTSSSGYYLGTLPSISYTTNSSITVNNTTVPTKITKFVDVSSDVVYTISGTAYKTFSMTLNGLPRQGSITYSNGNTQSFSIGTGNISQYYTGNISFDIYIRSIEIRQSSAGDVTSYGYLVNGSRPYGYNADDKVITGYSVGSSTYNPTTSSLSGNWLGSSSAYHYLRFNKSDVSTSSVSITVTATDSAAAYITRSGQSKTITVKNTSTNVSTTMSSSKLIIMPYSSRTAGSLSVSTGYDISPTTFSATDGGVNSVTATVSVHVTAPTKADFVLSDVQVYEPDPAEDYGEYDFYATVTNNFGSQVQCVVNVYSNSTKWDGRTGYENIASGGHQTFNATNTSWASTTKVNLIVNYNGTQYTFTYTNGTDYRETFNSYY